MKVKTLKGYERKKIEQLRFQEHTGHVRCPLCKTPLHAVMTAQGPGWQCGCEELKKRKLLPAA